MASSGSFFSACASFGIWRLSTSLLTAISAHLMLRCYANWNVMVMFVVMSTACPSRVADGTNLLRHPARFFIQSVAKPVDHALHHHLAGGQKGDAQHDVALDLHLAGFAGVLHRRLRDDFEIGGDRGGCYCWGSAATAVTRECRPNPPCRRPVFAVPVAPGMPARPPCPPCRHWSRT